MSPERDPPAPRRKPDWVLAVLAGTAVASVLAAVLVWSTWAPPGPDAAQVAQWRQRSLAACRAHPDLLAHLRIAAVPYDRLALHTAQFRFTLHRDGRAELHVDEPEAARGDFTLRIAPADFARLASLAAALQFEQRGSRKPVLPDGGETALEAGQGGQVAFVANETSVAGEFQALEQCLRSLSSDQPWVRDASADAIIVD
jgi:hypothetical protein